MGPNRSKKKKKKCWKEEEVRTEGKPRLLFYHLTNSEAALRAHDRHSKQSWNTCYEQGIARSAPCLQGTHFFRGGDTWLKRFRYSGFKISLAIKICS